MNNLAGYHLRIANKCPAQGVHFRQFDIIFSNHVIEHIDNITHALRETQRIGTSSCIYAFSVPTNIWLLLSIPAQYYNKMRSIARKLRMLLSKPTGDSKMNGNKRDRHPDRSRKAQPKYARYLRFIMPGGHGVSSQFIECYRKFRIRSWQQLLSESGFSIIKVKPLLLYGPSEWPVIPTLNCRTSLCSSVLFLMKKNL